MKSFLEHIKEEVLPSVQVADGGLDIEKPAVRAAINAAIAGVVSQPAVTPYVVFNRLSKLLAQYHIVLPRKFLEGDKGVEVFEVRQYGLKMGMTDQGEFIKSTPGKYYLFFHYHLIGSMYSVRAKIVDEVGLNKEMDFAEAMIAEGAAMQQGLAKAVAPKEPMHDEDGDGTESTKKAVEVSMRRKDKKLSDASLDEGRMPASVIKSKQKIANMSDDEKKKHFAGKSQEELKSMAWRHGYGKMSPAYWNRIKHLEEAHKALDKRIDTLEQNGLFEDLKLEDLKKQRLHYKDELVKLRLKLAYENGESED